MPEAWRAWQEAPGELGENFALALTLLLAGRPVAARERLDLTLDLYPGYPPAQSLKPLASLQAGEAAAALAAARSAATVLRPPLDRFSSVPALVLTRLGRTQEAFAFVLRWRELARDAEWIAPTAQAVAALAMGDTALARRWIQRAHDESDPWLVVSRRDPVLAELTLSLSGRRP